MHHHPKVDAAYQGLIDWIAENEEPECADLAQIARMPCIVFMAKVFKVRPRNIAFDVMTARARFYIRKTCAQ